MAQRSPRQSFFSKLSSSNSGSASSGPKSRNDNSSKSQPRRRSRRSTPPQPQPVPRRDRSPESRQNVDPSRLESFEPLVSQLRQQPPRRPKSRQTRSQPGKRPRQKVTLASILSFLKPPISGSQRSRRLPRDRVATTSVGTPRDQSVKRIRKKRRVSPMVYATRLLILGIGIGVISGTILSILNALGRSSAEANQTINLTLEQQQNPNSNPSNTQVQPLQLTQEAADLKTAILALAQDSPKLKPGVFLVDLDTGNYVDISGETPIPAASTIKVPILVSFFQAVDEGRIRLDEILTMEEKHIAKGSGELQDKPVGSKFTALETATLMITNSDNTATNMIIDRLGGIESLNQQFVSWQLKQTQMQNILPDLEGTNKTSSKDLVTLMAEINQGKLVSVKSRDFMLRIMQQTRNRSLLPSGLGEGAFIAHKTGNIDTVSGDIGLVDMPNGKRYLVGVLVQREADDPQAEELIRQISSTIYQYFDSSTNPVPNSDSSPAPDEVQSQDDQQ
ncbi:Beta-lactamase TEM-12 [Planktothrix tepida]|uniref:Beta-lactamase TEM-12 n=1 Tax=Planktothrix pseudagardhii TaxID=132604 RepID=A0A9W4CJW3_9CYAN|nr:MULTISPECIES: serine hydrolase [Planktothrix]CAD5921406.1 Beta-lactamase TEM-12 [Planktothrix pseudagardhii]CAD5981242.1 Beta-lactamase TEM-12 [Planktothrix tepida]